MHIKFPFWPGFFLVLILLIAPVSSISGFAGGVHPLHPCSHPICGDTLDPINPDPRLEKIIFVYTISDEKKVLPDNFTFNVSLIRNNKIGEVQTRERNGTIIFDNLTAQRSTRESYILRYFYSNSSIGNGDARIHFDIYLVKEGESDRFPTPAPTMSEPPIQSLHKNGVNETLSLVRGQPFSYVTFVSQPRIAGRNNITMARFWIFGDHYAEVITVPVNRVNGSVNFTLNENQTRLMNGSSYRLYVEYPPEWDFFQVYLLHDECVGSGICCSASCPFRMSGARTMSGSAGARTFETIVTSINLVTPVYTAQILVQDDTTEKTLIIQDPAHSHLNDLNGTSATPRKTPLSLVSSGIAAVICGIVMRFVFLRNS